MTLAEAYRHCETLARGHYENFNVGGWITPKQKLPHVYAIYAWCRMVDDLGDEALPSGPAAAAVDNGKLDDKIAAHRRSQLAWWEDELEAIYSGQPTHPISIAVQHTVASFDIPREPFQLLIQANLMDQEPGVSRRWTTWWNTAAIPRTRWDTCICTCSGTPTAGGSSSPTTPAQPSAHQFLAGRQPRLSDRGRIYLPQTDMRRFGVTESDIASGTATDAFRSLLRYECDIAMRMFQQGAPLVESLDRRAQLPVALFTRGGAAVLHAIRRQGYDVLSHRPALSKRQKAWLLASAWLGNKLGAGYGLPKP